MDNQLAAPTVQTYIAMLVDAFANKPRRREVVVQFQKTFWNGPDMTADSWVKDILGQLAYDLDFYEADPEARRGDPTFYGDDRFELEIRKGLRRLQVGGISLGKQAEQLL